MKHICFSESLYHTLSSFIMPRSIFCLPLHLSIGSIMEPLNYESRVDIYRKLEPCYSSSVKKYIYAFNKVNFNCPNIKFFIWVSSLFSWEYCGLLHLISNCPNASPYIIDPRKIYEEESIFKNIGSNCLSDLSEKELKGLQGYAYPISAKEKQGFISNWRDLVDQNSTLRIIHNSKVISVSASYYDEVILNNMPKQPIKVAIAIAQIFANIGVIENDVFIAERMNCLIQQGHIELVDAGTDFHHSYIRKV